MDIDEFWAIVERSRRTSEPERQLKVELAKLPESALVSYQSHLDTLMEQSFQWALWGAAFLIEGGCSDDGFIDFRYGLIARGRAVFEDALSDPDSLVRLGTQTEISNEAFGYVALEVYDEATGRNIPRANQSNLEDPPGEGWDFEDEEENVRRLPKLTTLHS